EEVDQQPLVGLYGAQDLCLGILQCADAVTELFQSFLRVGDGEGSQDSAGLVHDADIVFLIAPVDAQQQDSQEDHLLSQIVRRRLWVGMPLSNCQSCADAS